MTSKENLKKLARGSLRFLATQKVNIGIFRETTLSAQYFLLMCLFLCAKLKPKITIEKGGCMEKSISIDKPIYEQQSLCINAFGHSVTSPFHKCGPSVRSYYLIHFILEGKGEFYVNNTNYKLSAGQGFLIEPDYQTVYMADGEEPWTYIWVGFSGESADSIISALGLSQEQPVFSSPESEKLKSYVMEMIRHNHSSAEESFYTLGMLFLFLSTIAGSNKDILPQTEGNTYVNQAISYIQNHISEPLQVDEIARYVGLNRSYLNMLFKQHTGLSPLKYIQRFRLTKAKHLLESSRLSVSAIAYSCGYQRPESLIKIFRQTAGISPAAYRRAVISRTNSIQEKVNEEVPLSETADSLINDFFHIDI